MLLSETYKNRIKELAGILNEDFKSQKAKFISQGFEEEIVDRYINDFKEIRDKKYKEAKDKELSGLNVPTGNARFDIDSYKTFRELEILVDYVAGQRKAGSANFEDIKVDGKPIFENNDVEIYYADTPRACIQYKGNKPYGWCVARSDVSNMFYNYRLQQHEPAFYFVKRKAATDKEFSFWNLAKDVFTGKFKDKYHFFVIQVLKGSNISNEKNQNYIVTSAMNDGDKKMSWNDILTFAPELNGLQQIFEPKPLTPQEREKIDKYEKGLSNEEFAKLPYKEKDYYMSVYVKMDKPLSNGQFEELPEDLKNKYVGFGVGLSNEQFESIKSNSKLVKRYAEISNLKFDEFIKDKQSIIKFTYSEILFVDKEKLKNLTDDNVYNLLRFSKDKDQMANIILKYKGGNLTDENVCSLLAFSQDRDEMANILGKENINKLSDNSIYLLLKNTFGSDYDKEEMANIILKYKGDNLTDDNVYNLLRFSKDKDQMANIILKYKIENNQELTDENVHNLLNRAPDKAQIANIILKYKIENNQDLTDGSVADLLGSATDKDQMANIILKYKKENNQDLTDGSVSDLLYHSKNKYQMANIILKYKIENNQELTDNNVKTLFIYATNKDKMKNLLLNYISKDRINDIIQKNQIKTKLIPESHSIYNLRKTIKKLIKENYNS